LTVPKLSSMQWLNCLWICSLFFVFSFIKLQKVFAVGT
jgi:hypothetical protein